VIPLAETNYNRLVAQILGAVLVLVGLIGFVNDPVLGVFDVNLLHNVVHLLSGGVLLAAAFMDGGRNARLTNMVLGVVYLVVAAATWIGPLRNVFALNMADAGLHVLIAVVLLGVAFAMKGETRVARPK
jgi:uncharacterized membrane protein HdeD (DUF308 family)